MESEPLELSEKPVFGLKLACIEGFGMDANLSAKSDSGEGGANLYGLYEFRSVMATTTRWWSFIPAVTMVRSLVMRIESRDIRWTNRVKSVCSGT